MTERKYVLDTPQRRDWLSAQIGRLNVERPWEVVLKPYHPTRSNDQNARLWLLHTKAAEFTGYSPEEMHEFALARFFGRKLIECGGVKIGVPNQRSSKQDTKRFTEFMESTEAWYVTEFGVFLDG